MESSYIAIQHRCRDLLFPHKAQMACCFAKILSLVGDSPFSVLVLQLPACIQISCSGKHYCLEYIFSVVFGKLLD